VCAPCSDSLGDTIKEWALPWIARASLKIASKSVSSHSCWDREKQFSVFELSKFALCVITWATGTALLDPTGKSKNLQEDRELLLPNECKGGSGLFRCLLSMVHVVFFCSGTEFFTDGRL
jgi:hypothetical protein